MNELQIFKSHEFGEIRTTIQNGEPWFVAADVCKALDIENNRKATNRLDDDEKGVTSSDTLGGKQKLTIVNEAGLYSLVLGSRKPEAKAFKRWITHEVLPTIRRTGGYVNSAEAFIGHYLPHADESTRTMFRAQLKAIEELNAKIEADKPKVLFADAVYSSDTTILVGEMAKILKQNGVDISQKRFFEWLRQNGYLIKRKGSEWNMPTQRSMELGLFEIKESTHLDGNGCNITTKTPKITGKGQQYFIGEFLHA